MLKKTLTILGLIALSLTSKQASAQIETYVYFSDYGASKIKVYKLNTVDDELDYVSEISTDGQPYPLEVNADNSVLYSGNWVGNFNTGTGKIQSFTLNKSTGALTLLNTVTSIDIPVHISLSNNNNFLLSCSYGRNGVATQAINVNGSVNSTLIEDISVPNGSYPHMIKTNPDGDIVYSTNAGSDLISQYSFNDSNGDLTVLSPASIDTSPTDQGPRHFVFHPTLDIVYFSNEDTHTIRVNTHSSTGLASTKKESVNILDGASDAGRKTSDIHITPDGKFLYAAVRRPNFTEGTISAFSIDQVTGQLTLVNEYATDKVVREFEITPDGAYLIAAGETSGDAILYAIENDGSLTSKQTTTDLGTNLYWVKAISIDTSTLSSASINNTNEFSVSPNPFSETFTVALESPLSSFDNIKIIDTKGATINHAINEANKLNLDITVPNVAPGIYYLVISQNGKVKTIKLLAK